MDGDTITDHELNEPFTLLAEAHSAWQGYVTDTRHHPRPQAPQVRPQGHVQPSTRHSPHNAVAPHPKPGTALQETSQSHRP